jgi:hypothetical protein
VKLAASIASSTTPASTTNFAPSMGSRRGTTVNEERIMPVLYSPVISSTPSTPMASCAKNMPDSERETADSPSPRPPGWFAVMVAIMAPRPAGCHCGAVGSARAVFDGVSGQCHECFLQGGLSDGEFKDGYVARPGDRAGVFGGKAVDPSTSGWPISVVTVMSGPMRSSRSRAPSDVRMVTE